MDDFGLEWKRLGVLFFFGEFFNVCDAVLKRSAGKSPGVK